MTERFEDGQVVRYPYLWLRQYEDGRDSPEKDRPVCLAITFKRQGITHLVILPITGSPPAEGRSFIDIPELEMHRAGLSSFKRAWLAVDEYNYDVVERSFYFDSNQRPRGSFSGKFLKRILIAVRPIIAARTGRVDRTS